MGRIYTGQFNGVAATAQQDFFEVAAPSDAVVLVHGWGLSQETEVADAAEEMLRILVKRGEGSVTSGAGGSTVTARPKEKGDAAFGGTVEANNTTKMATGSGTIVTLYPHTWNVRVPLDVLYAPELRPVITPSDRLTIELATTPADSITLSGYIVLEEVGG